jgi:hypothetical protein
MIGSSFSSDRQVVDQIRRLDQGDTSEEFPSHWESWHGILHLQMKDGSREILLVKPAGDAVTVPPGDAVTVPPGNAVTVPPGKRRSGVQDCDPHAFSPDPWDSTATKPGLLWQGQDTMGFSMTFGNRAPILLYPDRAGIEFQAHLADLASNSEVVRNGQPILTWLDNKLPEGPAQYASESSFRGDGFEVAQNKFVLTSADVFPAKIERHKNTLDITLFGPPPGNEKIAFTLNEYGALDSKTGNAEKEFRPQVEVKGANGGVYVIDLKRLFFAEAGHFEAFGKAPSLDSFLAHVNERYYARNSFFSAKARQKHVEEMLRRYEESQLLPQISYRPKCSSEQWSEQFSSRQDISPVPLRCQEADESSPVPFVPLIRELLRKVKQKQ